MKTVGGSDGWRTDRRGAFPFQAARVEFHVEQNTAMKLKFVLKIQEDT